MFTEYIFENKKYENAVRDLKSTLFDIVAIENAKLSDIELRASREFNPERQEELRILCEQQEACLKRALEISGELSDSLMQLDLYSKELKKLEDDRIAEMIANLGDKKVENAYKKDVLAANQERDSLAREMIQTVNEMEDSVAYPKSSIVENIRTIQQGPEKEEYSEVNHDLDISVEHDLEENGDLANMHISEVAEEAFEDNQEEIEVEEENTDFVSTESDEKDGRNEGYDEIEEDVNTVATEESEMVDLETPDENRQEYETVGTENIAIDSNIEEKISDVEDSEINQEVDKPVELGEENNLIEESRVGRIDEVSSLAEIIGDATKKGDIVLPKPIAEPIAEVKDIEEKNGDQDVSDVGDENSSPIDKIEETKVAPLEPIINLDIPVVSEIVDKQQAIAEENQELAKQSDMGVIQKLRFLKANANVTRAIITAKKQITNLRNSRETAKALLKVRDSVGDVPIATNTLQAVDKSLENEQEMEQKLIDNGLLEPNVVDKQRKIEEMLEKANNLYKEGNVAEAQVMYDQISALNKEIKTVSNSNTK